MSEAVNVKAFRWAVRAYRVSISAYERAMNNLLVFKRQQGKEKTYYIC